VGFIEPALGTHRASVAPIVKCSCLSASTRERVNQNIGRRNSQGRPAIAAEKRELNSTMWCSINLLIARQLKYPSLSPVPAHGKVL